MIKKNKIKRKVKITEFEEIKNTWKKILKSKINL